MDLCCPANPPEVLGCGQTRWRARQACGSPLCLPSSGCPPPRSPCELPGGVRGTGLPNRMQYPNCQRPKASAHAAARVLPPGCALPPPRGCSLSRSRPCRPPAAPAVHQGRAVAVARVQQPDTGRRRIGAPARRWVDVQPVVGGARGGGGALAGKAVHSLGAYRQVHNLAPGQLRLGTAPRVWGRGAAGAERPVWRLPLERDRLGHKQACGRVAAWAGG